MMEFVILLLFLLVCGYWCNDIIKLCVCFFYCVIQDSGLMNLAKSISISFNQNNTWIEK